MGVSFSFFFPKNGDFSTPISPFSVRGVGVNFNDFLGVQTGFSLYRMTGMNVVGLPFESTKPLLGPNFTFLVPAELVLQFSGNSMKFNVKGGGFFYYSFDQRLNYGIIDKALREHYQLQVVDSKFDFDNKPGFGYLVGIEYIFYLSKGYGISLEGNYYVGRSSLALRGTYQGGTGTVLFDPVAVDYPDSKVDFTGLEVSIGVLMGGGNGGQNKKKKRRR